MKILFLSQSSPFREGGIETRSREIALRLAREGHEVQYLCAKTRTDESPEEIYQGVKILRKKVVPDGWLKKHPFPHYSTLAMANLLMMIHLMSLLRRENFDLLREEVAPVPISGILSLWRLSMRRVGIVHMLPGTWKKWTHFYGWVYGSFGYFTELALVRGLLKYDKVILASREPINWLRSWPSLRGKIEFVPNGVNFGSFHPSESVARDDKEFRMLTVGRLVKTKGHRYLIEALARLKSPRNFRLTLVGSGPLKRSLQSMAEKRGVASHIEFIDAIPFEEMPDFLRRFHLLVMPSLLEGFNILVLESLASGLPVAVSDIPGFRDIADETSAAFFPAENAPALAETLRRLMSEPKSLEELRRRGRQSIRMYDWDRSASEEAKVYSGVSVHA